MSKIEKEIVDQILHFLWSFIALFPIAYSPSPLTGALSGFLLCAPREFIDQWHGWPIGRRKLLDVLFFILGGLTVGIIL